MKELIVIALALVGGLVMLPMKWRLCVKIVFLLVVFEGALRKWFLPGIADFIYFGKDSIMLVAYLKFMIEPSQSKKSYYDIGSSHFLTFLSVLAILIPMFKMVDLNLGNPIAGMFGFKNYALYIPLIFLMPHLYDNIEDFIKEMVFYSSLSLPLCIIALIQYRSPGDSFINKFVGETVNDASVGDAVRTSATFSYLTGYPTYLLFIGSIILPFLTSKLKAYHKNISYLSFVFLWVALLTTGSRGALYSYIVLVVFYLICNENFWKKGYYKKLIPVFLIAAVALPTFFPQHISNFIDRAKQSDAGSGEKLDRILWFYSQIRDNLHVGGLFGLGTGITHPAVNKLSSMLSGDTKDPIIWNYVEAESAKIFLEIGLLGVCLWYLFRIYILIALLRLSFKLKIDLLKGLAFSTFLLHLLRLNDQLVTNITFQPYYWMTTGFLLMLPHLERKYFLHLKSGLTPTTFSRE
ncbi:MAG: hypothetical protein KBC84_00720 [Proteobacteria bacterium]|nr:hypothetical protein [Pseudomonadota bacterium]